MSRGAFSARAAQDQHKSNTSRPWSAVITGFGLGTGTGTS
jgi:hypothetical protein